MIVSHRNRFIFLKTRKTAGTSVELVLRQICGDEDIITRVTNEDEALSATLGPRKAQNDIVAGRQLVNHDSAAVVREAVGEACWRDYYKLSLERNPFDKAISLYYWSTQRDRQPRSLSDFLSKCNEQQLSNWAIYAQDDVVVVDHVMRFERLDEELSTLEQRLGIRLHPLPHAKGAARRDRRPFREVLSNEDRMLIERVCGREIKRFGYEW